MLSRTERQLFTNRIFTINHLDVLQYKIITKIRETFKDFEIIGAVEPAIEERLIDKVKKQVRAKKQYIRTRNKVNDIKHLLKVHK